MLILEPANGSVSSADVVIVRGLAAPGSIMTRVVPFWFDEHTTTDSVGRWSLAVGLNTGENVITLRVADDLSTTQTLTIYYYPS